MNQEEYYQIVGNNIRSLRKIRHLTQGDLAGKISKSLACVSKYEKGEIAIDIYTLIEIANALDVTLSDLVYDPLTSQKLITKDLPEILRKTPLYLYLWLGHERRIEVCVLEIHEDYSAKLFVGSDNIANPNHGKCKYYMDGTVSITDAVIRLDFRNPMIRGDFALFCFSTVSIYERSIIGSCTSLNKNYHFLTIKCLLSEKIMSDKNELQEILAFTREDYLRFRNDQQLLI